MSPSLFPVTLAPQPKLHRWPRSSVPFAHHKENTRTLSFFLFCLLHAVAKMMKPWCLTTTRMLYRDSL